MTPTHRGNGAPTAGRGRPGGDGDSRPLADKPDSRHLLTRRPRAGGGRREAHREGAVGVKWQPRWHRLPRTDARLAANPRSVAVGPVGLEPTTRGLKVPTGTCPVGLHDAVCAG